MPTSVLNSIRRPVDINPAAGTLHSQDGQLTATARTVAGGARQVTTTTTIGADAATTYTLTIGADSGTTTAVSYTGSAVIATIAAGLAAAANAAIGVSNLVYATATATAVLLTGRVKGDTFVCTSSVAGGGGSIGASAITTTASDAAPVFGGRYVEGADYTGILGTTPGCAVLGTGTYTAQITTSEDIDTTYAIAADDTLTLIVSGDFDGLGRKEYTGSAIFDTSSAQTVINATYAINAAMPANTVSIANAGGVLTFTAEIAGIGFDVSGGCSESGTAAAITFTTGTPNGIPAPGGIVRKAAQMEMTATGAGRYTLGMSPSCLTQGDVWVEVDDGATIALTDPVFVRRVIAGTEVAGTFRGAQDTTDCLPLSAFGLGGQWLTTTQTGFHGKNCAALRVFPL